LALLFAFLAAALLAGPVWRGSDSGLADAGAAALAALAVFYGAVLGRRSSRDRAKFLKLLRRFVGSQNLLESVLREVDSSGVPESGAIDAGGRRRSGREASRDGFVALCRDLLGARSAELHPAGQARVLLEGPLVLRAAGAPGCPPEDLRRLERRLHEESAGGSTAPLFLSPGDCGDAVLALPLRGGSELSGFLLLGEKSGGGLYTQEEIDAAQAAGERMIDTLAWSRIARLIVSLQEERILESRLADQRARRALHDDILPLLHSSLLELSARGERESLEPLSQAHARISNLLRDMPAPLHPDLEKRGLTGALRNALEEASRNFDEVRWQCDPELEGRLLRLSPRVAEAILYACREALRNAARYARRPGRALTVRLALRWREGLEILIEDDGGALHAARETESSPDETFPEQNLAREVNSDARAGAGQGLALHSAMMALVGGSLALESEPGRFTRVRIRLPKARLARGE